MAQIVYKWNPRPGFDFKGNPQEIGEHIEELATATGSVTPVALVEDARNPASPLHENFDWDDSTAAGSWREHTARNLIGSLVVVKVNEKQVSGTVRAFVSVRVANEPGVYKPIVTVMEDAELRKQMMERARQELHQWRNRYADLQEFSKVFKAVDELLPVLSLAA
jgi:prophage tail gpP-like protein